jgi:hypothetical protein
VTTTKDGKLCLGCFTDGGTFKNTCNKHRKVYILGIKRNIPGTPFCDLVVARCNEYSNCDLDHPDYFFESAEEAVKFGNEHGLHGYPMEFEIK